MSLSTDTIESLDTNESEKIYTRITSAEYFTPGSHILTYTISGILVSKHGAETPFTETRQVTLLIHDTTRHSALDFLKTLEELIQRMSNTGFKVTRFDQWYQEAQNALILKDYDGIKEINELALEAEQSAYSSNNILHVLAAQVAVAQEQQIGTPNTSRIMTLATLAFNRGDYETALARAEEAQLTFSLETKGEFNLLYFLTLEWQAIMGLAVVNFVILYFLRLGAILVLINRKLLQMELEEELLLQLIKETQQRCFIQNKISMSEYYDSLKQFETKLSETIETTIKLQSLKNNLFRFTPTTIRLTQEKDEILGMIKDTQTQYFQKGLLETRIYHTKMKSFTKRLSTVEKNIVLEHAKRALRQNTGITKPIWRTVYSVWK